MFESLSPQSTALTTHVATHITEETGMAGKRAGAFFKKGRIVTSAKLRNPAASRAIKSTCKAIKSTTEAVPASLGERGESKEEIPHQRKKGDQ